MRLLLGFLLLFSAAAATANTPPVADAGADQGLLGYVA